MNTQALAQAVADVRKGAALPEVLEALYGGGDASDGLDARLRALGPALGSDFAELIEAAERMAYADGVLALNAALGAMPYGQEWLNFALALKLAQLAKLGQAAARPASLRHAEAALAHPGLNPSARANLRQLLADLQPSAAPEGDGPGAAREPGLIGAVRVLAELPGDALVLEPPAGDGRHYIFTDRRFPRPPIQVVEIEDAVVSIDVSRAGLTEFHVFDRNGERVTAVSYGREPFADAATPLDACLALADDRFAEVNVCHFLLDKLSRRVLYDRCAPEPYRLLLFRRAPYYDAALRLAGAGDYVAPSTPRASFRVRRLLASTNVARDFRHPAHYGAPWAIDGLRRILGPEARTPSRRIFISRADAPRRRILNQPAIDPVLRRFGFESHALGALSLPEQISLLAEATHVVSVHGAGLANLLFAPPGARVLEILPPLAATPAYWMLAGVLGQPYAALIADDPEAPQPDYSHWRHDAAFTGRDLLIDPERLAGALAALTGDAR